MERKFLEVGEYGVLHFITERHSGVAVFKVMARQIIPFKYGNLPIEVFKTQFGFDATGIPPRTTTDPVRIYGTFEGKRVEDLFYFDDADTLIHVWMYIEPDIIHVMPYWISGYLQGDYHDILTATKNSVFGFKRPPLEFIAIPKVHLAFAFRNNSPNNTINPYIEWESAIYRVKYETNPNIIEQILRKKFEPKPKWFVVYGFKAFTYDFRENLKITKPIPVDASLDEIKKITLEWKQLGVWG